MCLTELELPSQHAQYFLPRTLRQSLSCVLIPFPCVLPGSRVEFCQWCALVRCSPFCLTFLFVPFAPRHHRTSHHGISTHVLHFGVTGFLLSPKGRRNSEDEQEQGKTSQQLVLPAPAGFNEGTAGSLTKLDLPRARGAPGESGGAGNSGVEN